MSKNKPVKQYKCPPIDLICPPKMFNIPQRQTQNRSFDKRDLQSNSVCLQQKIEMVQTQAIWGSYGSYKKPLDHSQFDRTFQSNKKTDKHRLPRHISPYIRNQKDFQKILSLMKRAQGPTESLLKQIKKHNEQNHKNAQLVIMKRQSNFPEKLLKFTNRLGLMENSKIFVMNSQDQHIREALKNLGWIENPHIESTFYHLKWVYKDSNNDYQSLQQSQFYNHFRNNQQLTNKNNLRKNLKKRLKNQQPNVPITYDLQLFQDINQFTEKYQQYNVYSILSNLKQIMQKSDMQFIRKFNKNPNYKKHQNKRSLKISKTIGRNIVKQLLYIDKNIQELSPMLYFLQLLCGYISQIIFRQQHIIYSIFKHDPEIWNNQSRQVIQYLKIYFNHSQNNFPKQLSSFYKVQLLKMYYYLNGYWGHNFGKENIWITKPTGVSRGTGITLDNNYSKILSKRYGKIVQKYIQNPLLLSCGRKFDIRQWVLVKSFQPLQIYIYQHCYCRFSSQRYNLTDFTNLKKHLTNYSKNRQSFLTKSNSVMSEEELQINIGRDKWDIIKNQIYNQIYKTLNCCSPQIFTQDGCFQVYGFDVLIDSSFKPWILQVNLSPACQNRAPFLKQYLDKMANGIVYFIEGKQPQGWLNLNYLLKINQQKQIQQKRQAASEKIQKAYKKYLNYKKINNKLI